MYTKSYLVNEELTTFNITFTDHEGDSIILKIDSHELISSFVTYLDDTATANLKLVARAVSDETTSLVVWYTDKYHQDDQFWRNVTLSLYLFESEPPVFDNKLEDVHADRCESLTLKLPSFHDPDGLLSK